MDKRLGSGKGGIKSDKKEDVGVPGQHITLPRAWATLCASLAGFLVLIFFLSD